MKSKSRRQLQMGEQIKRIVADFLNKNDMSRMLGSVITLLEADVSPDIKNVVIYVDIFGDKANNIKIINRLQEFAPMLRSELGKALSSRNTPSIKFILDQTEAKAGALESIIENEKKKFK